MPGLSTVYLHLNFHETGVKSKRNSTNTTDVKTKFALVNLTAVNHVSRCALNSGRFDVSCQSFGEHLPEFDAPSLVKLH